MDLLVLGGTGLTGSAIVEAARNAGHSVTVVHRGRSASKGATIPDGCESIVLDRAEGHEQLAERSCDAVIDVSGYVPAVVRDALHHLAAPGRPWVHVSTVSVYADTATPMLDETAAMATISDEAVLREALEDPRFDWRGRGLYGECKALCEDEVLAGTDGHAAILRPCVIAGAHDHTWRFGYWVARGMRDGTVLAPAPRAGRVAIVDVRDLAEFAVRCAERSIEGTFNIAPLPTDGTYERLVASTCGHLPVEWVDPQQLRDQGVEPWADLPFWLPDWTGSQGMGSFDVRRAFDAGFTTRPLSETAATVRDWIERTPKERLPDVGQTLTPEREAALLAG